MTRGLLPVFVAFSAVSCAAVWGFDDATLAREDGAPGTSDAAKKDPATRDAAMNDAATNDASVLDAPEVDAVAMEASPPVHDAAVDHGVPPPTCLPPCVPGSSCARAVGDAAVCVSMTQTCTDSADCLLEGCCVWLDYDSGVGRCESASIPGSASSPSCLCTTNTMGMPGSSCKKCQSPRGDPGAPVRVCGP